MANYSSKHKKSSRVLRKIIAIILIIVSIFAVINLVTDNYIRDVTIKGEMPRKY